MTGMQVMGAVAYLAAQTVCGAETIQAKEQHVTEDY